MNLALTERHCQLNTSLPNTCHSERKTRGTAEGEAFCRPENLEEIVHPLSDLTVDVDMHDFDHKKPEG